MFRLHETTRRRVCRWAFVLLCALPTLATLAWIAHQRRPGRVRAEQARLAGSLQAHLRLADWREPRPGLVRTTELEVFEPANRRPLTAVRGLEIRTSGDVRTLTAKGAALSVDQLGLLARRVPPWVAGLEERELRLRFDALTIAQADGGPTVHLHGVEAIVRRNGSGYEAQLQARFDSDAAASPRLRLTAAWSDSSPEQLDGWMAGVDCSERELPAWLLSAIAPIGSDWGAAATFTGAVRLDGDGNSSRGVARGQLRRIDVAACAAIGNLDIDGHADVQLDELRWQGERVERSAGVVQADNLAINTAVLAAAVNSLYCGVPDVARDSPVGSPVAITVDRLACRFQLEGVVLTLTGAFPADEAPVNCLATRGGRPLVTAPWQPWLEAGKLLPLHASAWLQFLGSGARGWIPASQQAVEVAGRLNLPATARTLDAPAAP